MSYSLEYAEKLTFAEEAVKVVSSRDRIRYAFGACRDCELDRALAARRDELADVEVYTDAKFYAFQVEKVDAIGKTFRIRGYDPAGSLVKRGRNKPKRHESDLYRISTNSQGKAPRLIFMAAVSPMDKDGRFCFAPGVALDSIRRELAVAHYVVVEINEYIPQAEGDNAVTIHISELDNVVPSSNLPLFNIQTKAFPVNC
jgi:acyl-CoA hydrolase